jgi:LPS-assembly lipoprotein
LVVVHLSGCGFHLRGSVQLPEHLSALYVEEQGAAQASRALNQLLRENDLAPVAEPSAADLIIKLSEEKHNKRVLSVGSSGKVQEFELIYRVKAEFLDQQGNDVADSDTLTLRRSLSFDETEVLSVSSEEQQIKQDMVNDAARQVLRRLQYIKGQ